MIWTPAAVVRIGLLCLLGGIFQLTAVSQFAIFGVPADITPLLAASVGLLAGSIAGAAFGFSLGLFMDTALLQTLGLTSLVLLTVGYFAGRLRELRDPAHGLVPLAVGAAATAVAVVGLALMQFLLGFEAPVSLQFVRQILMVVDPQLAARDARLRARAARAAAVPARGSAPAPPARVHDRRPEPAEPLMKQRIEERRPPITPQMALRVAVLGGFAFVLFAIVFFRLWFLQVLSGDQYVSEARENRVRKIKIEAPRGDIVDRNGDVLVKTRIAPVVQIIASSLPAAEQQAADQYRLALSGAERQRLAAKAKLRAFDQRLEQKDRKPTRRERHQRRLLDVAARQAPPVKVPPMPAGNEPRVLFHRLARVLLISPRTIHRRVVEGVAEASYRNITIKADVPRGEFNYLRENRESFPGVVVEELYLRDYPEKDLAAQLFGTVSEVTPEELKQKRYRGVTQGTRVGQSGLEQHYDRYLRGTDGYTRVVVNALGSRDDTRRVTRREPIQGQQLRLSLDLGLEKAADGAIKRGIAAANGNGNPAGAGAYVAINPRTGEIYALGSYPSFNANDLAKPISQGRYDQLTSEANGAPLINRAIDGTYPTGSIFKPITAIATMEGGVVTPTQTIVDDGKFQLGPQVFQNARGASYGALQMARALTVSSDVFFYTLGAWANSHGPVIQRWARRLGLGHRTGIDLPGEFGGLVPGSAWRDSEHRKYQRCTDRKHVPQGTQEALFKCGGIERDWSAGDNVNLAIGQGDLLATPLQMAVAYSALANGGTVPRPHLGAAVEDGHGKVIQEIRKSPRRHVKMDQRYLDVIMAGLHGATTDPKGTSADVFKGFPRAVYGKTGTAQHPGQADQSWYASYVPDASRPIVVVVTIEKGGFGAESAAPAARLILSSWFHLGEHDFKVGASQTR